jgi:hypothetical protein
MKFILVLFDRLRKLTSLINIIKLSTKLAFIVNVLLNMTWKPLGLSFKASTRNN